MIKYDADSGNLKMAENFYLRRACEDRSLDSLMQFSAMRRARGRIMDKDAISQESSWESIDGLAEYIRLINIAADKREQLLEEVARHLSILSSPQSILNPKLLSISTGAIICLSLKNLSIDFPAKLKENESIFDFVPKIKNELEKLL